MAFANCAGASAAEGAALGAMSEPESLSAPAPGNRAAKAGSARAR